MRLLPLGLVVTILSLGPSSVGAHCGDGPGDAVALANARAAVEATCGCATTPRHRIYVACAKREVKARIRHGLLSHQCGASVRRCAAHSTCGTVGAVACCLDRKGKPACKIVSRARCLRKHGCVGMVESCCDACTPAGCGGVTTTTTPDNGLNTTTTTTISRTTTTTLVDGQQCAQFTEGAANAPSETIACGIALACRIDPSGDTDAFTIDVPAGTALAVNAAGQFTTCWRAFDPDGLAIGSEHCDGLHVVPVTKTGTHTIRVRFYETSAVGDYTVVVAGVSATYTCGIPLSLPTALYNGALSPGGDIDTFQFVAAAGDGVSISVANPGDPCWQLYDPAGNIEKNDQCAPAGTTDVTALVAGTHTILVRHQLNRPTPYTLSLQRVTQ